MDIHPDDFSKLSDSELAKEITKYGYKLCPIYLGYRLCPNKLPSFGMAVENDTTQNVEYNWPFLDIFATAFFDKTGSINAFSPKIAPLNGWLLLISKNDSAETLLEQDAKTKIPLGAVRVAPKPANCWYFFSARATSFLLWMHSHYP